MHYLLIGRLLLFDLTIDTYDSCSVWGGARDNYAIFVLARLQNVRVRAHGMCDRTTAVLMMDVGTLFPFAVYSSRSLDPTIGPHLSLSRPPSSVSMAQPANSCAISWSDVLCSLLEYERRDAIGGIKSVYIQFRASVLGEF